MTASPRLAVPALSAALVLLCLFLYWPATGYELVWDDPIVLNQQINAFRSARDVAFPARDIPQFGTHYYRPTIVATYLLDRALFREGSIGQRLATTLLGLESADAPAFGYHLSVLAWHALATLLVFALGLELARAAGWAAGDAAPTPGPPAAAAWGGVWPAALGAALFAVHPVHTESVAWMTGRSDTVCAVFVLAALILHLRARRGLGGAGAARSVAVAAGCAALAVAFVFTLPGAGGGLALSVVLGLALVAGLAAAAWQTRRGAWNPLALCGPGAVLLLAGAGSKETALGFVLLLPLVELALAAPSGQRFPAAAADEPLAAARGERLIKGDDGVFRPTASASKSSATAALDKPRSAVAARGAGKKRRRRAEGRKGRRVVVRESARSRRRGPLAALFAAVPGYLPYAIVLGGYLVLRREALEGLRIRAKGAGGALAGVRDLLGSVGWYLREMTWPEFSAFVAGIPGGLPGLLLGLVAIPGAAAAGVFMLRRGWRAEAIALSIFAAFAAPSLFIVFKRVSETVLAERYLYIPSVGALLLLGLLLRRAAGALAGRGLRAGTAALVVAVLGVGVVWAAGTRARLPAWSDDLAFWRDAVAKAPSDGLPHLHLGKTLAALSEERFIEAETLRGLLGPRRETPPTAEMLARAEDLWEAARAFEAEAAEEYAVAWGSYDDDEGRQITCNNTGNLFQAKANRLLRQARAAAGEEQARLAREALATFDAARRQFRRAVTINPRYPKARYNWGLTEMEQANLATLLGDVEDYLRHLEEGVRHFEEAIALDSRYYLAYTQFGRRLQARGLYAEAREKFDLAARWARDQYERAAATSERDAAAERLAEWPEGPRAQARHLFELAERRRAGGDLFGAVDRYWAALRLDPALAEAHAGLGALFLTRAGDPIEQGRAGAALDALRRADIAFERAVRHGEDDAILRLARGQFLMDAGCPVEAQEEFAAAAARSAGPERERARAGRAAAERRVTGLPANASGRFRERIAAGDAHLAQGRLGLAAHAYWQAERIGHDPALAAEKLGALLLVEAAERQRHGEAHAAEELHLAAALDFERAAKVHPDRLSARQGAGLGYLEGGWPGEAVAHLAAAVRLSNTPADRDRLAEMLHRAEAESGRPLAP